MIIYEDVLEANGCELIFDGKSRPGFARKSLSSAVFRQSALTTRGGNMPR